MLSDEFKHSVQAALERQFSSIKHDCLPALVIGVVDCSGKKSNFDFANFGTAQYFDEGHQHAADENTVFSIASCSKAFNATTIGIAADRSIDSARPFSWDTLVKDAMSEFSLKDKNARDSLKLRDLCAHRSGLPGHIPVLGADDTPDDVMHRMAHIKPTASIRERAQYENSGIITSALALSRLTGRSLPDLAVEHIFEPLGMSSTTYFPSKLGENRETDNNSRLAHAFNVVQEPSGERKLRRVPFWLDRQDSTTKKWRETCLEAQFAPGGVCTTASDLLKFIECHLRNGYNSKGEQVLTKSALDETTKCHQATDRLSPAQQRKRHSHINFGLGWWIFTRRGIEIVQHGGGQRGVCTMILFAPPDFGLVIQSNGSPSCMNDLNEALTDHLVETRGRTAFDWTKETNSPPSSPRKSANSEEVVSQYAGHYISDCDSLYFEAAQHPGEAVNDFSKLEEIRNDTLYAKSDRFWWTHLKLTLKDASRRIFAMEYSDYFPSGYGQNSTPAYDTFPWRSEATFIVDSDGKPLRMLVNNLFSPNHQYPGDKPEDRAEIVYTFEAP